MTIASCGNPELISICVPKSRPTVTGSRRALFPSATVAIRGPSARNRSALTGTSIAEDLQKGLIDRFRSLPMAQSAVLVGRTNADIGNNIIVLIVMSLTGLLVGWRITSSVWEALAAYVLLIFLFFRECARAWHGPGRRWAEAGIAAAVALTFAGLFEFNFGDTEVFYLLLDIFALVFVNLEPGE